jgi:transposase
MPRDTLANFILLPELKLIRIRQVNRFCARYECEKEPGIEYCPKCATPSQSTYDHREVSVQDAPIRGFGVTLVIRKRRLWCKPCARPFTEPVPGIPKGKRHTERFVQALHWACENFSDLTRVKRAFHCSSDFLYRNYYKHLERKVGEWINYPWPKTVGIDEHAFRKHPKYGNTEFVSMIVDYDHARVREVVYGKTGAALSDSLQSIPERVNVQNVVLDLCDPFKNFAREFFPQARIVADKFHVLRLLSPGLLKRRRQITGTRADLRAKKLLLMSGHRLGYERRHALLCFLKRYPELRELYEWKERLHRFYRTTDYLKAHRSFRKLVDEMAWSDLPEIKTLRRTLLKWKEEILNYFLTGLTNARTEGFNNKAKVVKRRAYGYKSFRNYRLKVLTACA